MKKRQQIWWAMKDGYGKGGIRAWSAAPTRRLCIQWYAEHVGPRGNTEKALKDGWLKPVKIEVREVSP